MVDDLRRMLEDLRGEVRTLRADLDTERELRRCAADELRDLRSQLETERAQASERIGDLEDKIAGLVEQNDRFRARCPRDPQDCATLTQ